MKRNAKMFRGLLTSSVLLVVALTMLAACTLDTPPAPVESQAANEPTSDQTATAQETEDGTASGTVELLTFATQQGTFLSLIESATDDIGAPDARFFVELTTPDGDTWQGERFVYPDNEIILLQQAASDGLSAVRLELPADADQDAILALLPDSDAATGDQPNVDIHFVRARMGESGDPATWSFDVTVEHPDTGWEDYADGWHVETPDGEILGTRILVHPHVGEQPFTRSLSNIVVPEDVNEIRIRPHDLVSGYGPATDPISLAEAAAGESFEVVR